MQKSTFERKSTVLGIDACKDGWIVAKVQDENLQLNMYEKFSDIIKAHETVTYILVDIPVGLPETKEEANQRPEVDARKLLPKKASSVFTVPCKRAAEQSTFEAANKINKQVLGKGISKQSYYVMKKALEVNHYIEQNSESIHKIKESHPELQFAQFTETKLPITASKKTVKGMQERAVLLVYLLQTQLNI